MQEMVPPIQFLSEFLNPIVEMTSVVLIAMSLCEVKYIIWVVSEGKGLVNLGRILGLIMNVIRWLKIAFLVAIIGESPAYVL